MDARIVVLVDSNEGRSDPAVRQILAQARETGAAASVMNTGNMASLTDIKTFPEPPSAIVLGPAVHDPILIARRLRAAGLDSYIIFVADPSRIAEMRKKLFYMGPPGAQWSLEPADSARLAGVIQRGASVIERSKQLRLTLDRINVQIGQTPTIDTKRYRQLLVSDRYLASILEHAQDAIISLDLAGHVRSWNRGAEELLGVAERDALGVSVALLLTDPTTIEQSLGKAARGKVTRKELSFSSTEGIKFLDAVFTPIDDEAEGVLGVTLIIRDITSQKGATEALKDAGRRKDEFLAVLAHELRNPLAPVYNALQLMKMPDVSEADRERSRMIAERQVRHMTSLLDDLLDVSRMSRGRLKLRRELVPLSHAIDFAVETARPFINKKNQKLMLNLPSEPVILNADPIRLAQIFGNLLVNAAKYTHAQGEIYLTVSRKESFVVVSVKDNGIGIEKENLAKIFEMFSQASAEKAESGMGIGLAITRALVELHGGTIEARSGGAECGSEFFVSLPTSSRQQQPREDTAHEHQEHAPGRRVLIVDDNADAADSLAMTLQVSGHIVKTAYNGMAALEAIEQFRPDVVLLDLGMPQMDGYEVARRMNALPHGKEALLIALTGWGQEEDRRRTAAAGFYEHVTKPVDHSLLMKLIGRDTGT